MPGTRRALELLLALAALGAALTGCRTPYERLDEMHDAVVVEQNAYAGFVDALHATDGTFNQWDHETTGDTHFDELDRWRTTICEVRTEIDGFARWVNQVPPGPNADQRLAERRGSVDVSFLQEIRDELDANWSPRPDSIDYDMAPPWYLDQARDDGEAIEGCWAEIAGDHREAFDLLSNDDRDPDFATSLALTVSADERLYDTTQDCIATFEDYAELKEPVDYESRLCLDYGLEYLCDESGFQVDTWLLWELLEDAGQNAPDFYPGTWNTELDRYEHIGRSGCFDVIETDAYDKMSGEPIVQHLPAGASGLFTQDDGVRDAISREPLLW